MALSDPLSITIGSAISLPRVSTQSYESIYQSADKAVRESVRHQVSSKRTRSLVRVDKNVISADPLTSINTRYTGSVYVVCDFPLDGFSVSDKTAIATGLFSQLTASTNAMLIKVLGLES